MSRYVPNAFQIANDFVDEVMAGLSGSAVKCYLAIVRKTTGWQKVLDYIPIAQFKCLTGIKKAETVTAALNELAAAGLIVRVEQLGKVTGYSLKAAEPPPINRGTTTPENGVYPKNGTTTENGGYPPPINGGTTTPENGGTSKPTTKPTNTKPKDISAAAAAPAAVSAVPKPKKPTLAAQRKLEALQLLADHGVDGQLALDYLTVREDRKAKTLTPTAVAGLEREANRAGLSLTQAVTVCVERNWAGFNADWLHNSGGQGFRQPARQGVKHIPQHTQGGAFLAKDIL